MSKKLKILISSMHFSPENFRINDIAQEWVSRGYEVSVLTGYPNYPEGSLYPGYSRKIVFTEKVLGVEVIRIPILLRGNSIFRLILNYASFVVSGLIWALVSKSKPDVVFIFATSPIMQAIPPTFFAQLHRIPSVIYVQDLWPENVEAVYGIKSPLVKKPIEWIARSIFKRSSKILVPSPSFIDAIARHEVASNKIVYWPQHAELIAESTEAPAPEKPFKMIYAGNIGKAQRLDTLVDAVDVLAAKGVTPADLQVNILGDGRDKANVLALIAQKNLQSFFNFLGTVGAAEVPGILRQNHLCYLSLQDSMIFNMSIPAKLQTYLASGVPTLASARGEVEKILIASGAGTCVPPGNADALAQALHEFIQRPSALTQEMGQKGLRYCQEHFSKTKLFQEMDQLFASISSRRRG